MSEPLPTKTLSSLANSTQPTIRLSDTAYLRPLLPNEVSDDYVNGLNTPQVKEFLVGPSQQHQTRETVTAFVNQNLQADDSVLFGLFIQDRHSGSLRLHNISNDGAFIGIAIFRPEIWGQNWATRMIDAVSSFAAEEIGLKTVRARIEPTNTASQRAFEKAGFRPPTAGSADSSGDVWERNRDGAGVTVEQ